MMDRTKPNGVEIMIAEKSLNHSSYGRCKMGETIETKQIRNIGIEEFEHWGEKLINAIRHSQGTKSDSSVIKNRFHLAKKYFLNSRPIFSCGPRTLERWALTRRIAHLEERLDQALLVFEGDLQKIEENSQEEPINRSVMEIISDFCGSMTRNRDTKEFPQVSRDFKTPDLLNKQESYQFVRRQNLYARMDKWERREAVVVKYNGYHHT